MGVVFFIFIKTFATEAKIDITDNFPLFTSVGFTSKP